MACRRSTRRAPSTTLVLGAEETRAVASPSPLLVPARLMAFWAALLAVLAFHRPGGLGELEEEAAGLLKPLS